MESYGYEEFCEKLQADFINYLQAGPQDFQAEIVSDGGSEQLALSLEGKVMDGMPKVDLKSAHEQFGLLQIGMEEFIKELAKSYEQSCKERVAVKKMGEVIGDEAAGLPEAYVLYGAKGRKGEDIIQAVCGSGMIHNLAQHQDAVLLPGGQGILLVVDGGKERLEEYSEILEEMNLKSKNRSQKAAADMMVYSHKRGKIVPFDKTRLHSDIMGEHKSGR